MAKKLILICVACTIFAGCAANTPRLSRQEWLDLTNKTYQGVTKEEVLSAAETVFDLADGDDFVISHTQEGLQATRNWSVYLVLAAAMGTDYWKVTAVENEGAVNVSVQANTQGQAVTPMATSNNGWTATTSPLAGTPILGTAIYDVFWARLDYLLGKRNDWMI